MLTKFLADQSRRISKQAAQGYKAEVKIRKDDPDTTRDAERALAIMAMLKWDYETLYSQLEPYLEIAAEEGASAGAYQAAAHLGANLKQTQEPATKTAKAAAQDRAAELVGMQMSDGELQPDKAAEWAMSTTAKDDTLRTLRQALAENWTASQLEAVLQASAVFTPDHAEMIADNEVTRQQASGHLAAWQASGKVLKYAWTVADLGCCAVCAGFSALGSVPAGYQFAMMIYAPGAHPFCRCWLTATQVEGPDGEPIDL